MRTRIETGFGVPPLGGIPIKSGPVPVGDSPAGTGSGGQVVEDKPSLRRYPQPFVGSVARRHGRVAHATPRSIAAFTMIEIALSLAVIAFALIAIIGVLPSGMTVQQENREETIVGQDASVFMNAIRNGMQGMDDLTNYVTSITNYVTFYHNSGSPPQKFVNWYNYTNSSIGPGYPITNGLRIIGLLSTPKIVPYIHAGGFLNPLANPEVTNPLGGFWSNHVVAIVRSMSGPSNEKPPQTNQDSLDLAFTYRLISEVVPYENYSTNWFYTHNANGTITTNFAYAAYVQNMQSNSYDLRLTFLWPPQASHPNRQVFRAPILGSYALVTSDAIGLPITLPPNETPNWLYFFQPSVFVQAPYP
jgi:type II secretory pathway pseudopilin PulG